MNARTILSADGRVRRAFTVSDLFRMVEAGIVGEDERIEVVAGELFPMAAKGIRHEVLKQHLNLHLALALPAGFTFIPEPGWTLSELLYLEPDYLVFPARLGFAEVKGPQALLVIEVADSSLGYDLGRKPALYAAEGVREYWVVDAQSRETHVHREPAGTGYASVRIYPAAVELTAALIPGFKVRMADLPET
ncbi:Uma2 family endonuclease [Prosthecomicrobium sp. N25]|uniref:Uma2 family endonuclease n=1 Tax=Prosthecomicrobium sp. N25 TaxID=3129254 RepID=UPI003077C00B